MRNREADVPHPSNAKAKSLSGPLSDRHRRDKDFLMEARGVEPGYLQSLTISDYHESSCSIDFFEPSV